MAKVCNICGLTDQFSYIYYTSAKRTPVTLCSDCYNNIISSIIDLLIDGYTKDNKQNIADYVTITQEEQDAAPNTNFVGTWTAACARFYPTVKNNRLVAFTSHFPTPTPNLKSEGLPPIQTKSEKQKEMEILFGREENVNSDGTLKHSESGYRFL